jgi:hypothetical protein
LAWKYNLTIKNSVSMPGQLFTYYIENSLMIKFINSGSWGVMVIRLVIDLGELVKVALNVGMGKGVGGWGKW